MCEDCEKIEEIIARYRRIQQQIGDRQVQEAAERLVAELIAKKAALHPDASSDPPVVQMGTLLR